MIFNIRCLLWNIVAELEYHLYPWTEEGPSIDIIRKYNLPEEPFDKNLHYDWLKSHDQKIDKLEKDIKQLFFEVDKLRKK